MAVNIIYDRIFKGLRSVIGPRVIVGNTKAAGSAEYVRLSMAGNPEHIETTGPSRAMLYSVNIDLITNKSSNARYLSQAVSNIIDSLNDNTAYAPDGVHYWINGQVIPSEYGPLTDEDGQEIYDARILWTATHTEIK